jgi:hypothetical protein
MIGAVTVNLDLIRSTLAETKNPVGAALVTDDSWDRVAAGVREAMVACDLDPANPEHQRAMLVGSFLSFQSLIHSGGFILGPGPVLLWTLAEVERRWVDGEMPTVSIGDMLGVEFQDLHCDEMIAWPTGKGSSKCKRTLGHQIDGLSHAVSIPRLQDDGSCMVVEVEVE